MGKAKTLQEGITRLPKRVTGKTEKPSRKRTLPGAKQIGAALGALVAAVSAVFAGRAVRKARRER
jgi:hypothetical protein